MLMVIFGAGASYDSAQAFPLPGSSSVPQNVGTLPAASILQAGPWRPPLAVNLFRDPELVFGHIVQRYPKLSHILPHLRQPLAGRSEEEELELLQEQAVSGYAERLRQFASVRYYLRDFLFEVSNQWNARTSGVTNYAILVDQLLRHNEDGHPICLVTFNYDLLLDRALVSFGYKPQTPENQFKRTPYPEAFQAARIGRLG